MPFYIQTLLYCPSGQSSFLKAAVLHVLLVSLLQLTWLEGMGDYWASAEVVIQSFNQVCWSTETRAALEDQDQTQQQIEQTKNFIIIPNQGIYYFTELSAILTQTAQKNINIKYI